MRKICSKVKHVGEEVAGKNFSLWADPQLELKECQSVCNTNVA